MYVCPRWLLLIPQLLSTKWRLTRRLQRSQNVCHQTLRKFPGQVCWLPATSSLACHFLCCPKAIRSSAWGNPLWPVLRNCAHTSIWLMVTTEAFKLPFGLFAAPNFSRSYWNFSSRSTKDWPPNLTGASNATHTACICCCTFTTRCASEAHPHRPCPASAACSDQLPNSHYPPPAEPHRAT